MSEPDQDRPGGGSAGVHSGRAARLLELLRLTDDELCATLGADPLTILSGQLDHRPELAILLTLLQEPEQQVGAAALARWVRIAGPGGRPVDALTARDFPAFEDALARLSQRGLIVRGGGRSGPGTSPDASRDRGPSGLGDPGDPGDPGGARGASDA